MGEYGVCSDQDRHAPSSFTTWVGAGGTGGGEGGGRSKYMWASGYSKKGGGIMQVYSKRGGGLHKIRMVLRKDDSRSKSFLIPKNVQLWTQKDEKAQ